MSAATPPRATACTIGLNEGTRKAWHAVDVTECRMRFVVFGAGAIGGLVGARLFQHGADVTLIARGDHARALASGLVLEAPDESVTLPIPVVTEARGVTWTEDTVVLLGVKGQHTEDALAQLVQVAPPDDAGRVHAERGRERTPGASSLSPYVRHVRHVPATHLRPGVIQAHSAPVSGLLDLGRYPTGVDDAARPSPARSTPRPSSRWPGPTSCGGNTASSS